MYYSGQRDKRSFVADQYNMLSKWLPHLSGIEQPRFSILSPSQGKKRASSGGSHLNGDAAGLEVEDLDTNFITQERRNKIEWSQSDAVRSIGSLGLAGGACGSSYSKSKNKETAITPWDGSQAEVEL